jgi:hypothetical protein
MGIEPNHTIHRPLRTRPNSTMPKDHSFDIEDIRFRRGVWLRGKKGAPLLEFQTNWARVPRRHASGEQARKASGPIMSFCHWTSPVGNLTYQWQRLCHRDLVLRRSDAPTWKMCNWGSSCQVGRHFARAADRKPDAYAAKNTWSISKSTCRSPLQSCFGVHWSGYEIRHKGESGISWRACY